MKISGLITALKNAWFEGIADLEVVVKVGPDDYRPIQAYGIERKQIGDRTTYLLHVAPWKTSKRGK